MEKNKLINANKNELKTFNVNETFISMFQNANIITQKDQENLVNVKEFIVDNYAAVPMYRALPIKLFAILGSPDYPTVEAKYWQCKVEAEVHGNELVRDLHQLELMKIKIEKMDYILNTVMKDQLHKTDDSIKKELIKFDMKEQNVLMSEAKFEYMQILKKIKYRIDEVADWKMLSEKLETAGKKNGKEFKNYDKMLTDSLRLNWNAKLKDKEVSEEDKKILEAKLKTLDDTFKSPEQKP